MSSMLSNTHQTCPGVSMTEPDGRGATEERFVGLSEHLGSKN